MEKKKKNNTKGKNINPSIEKKDESKNKPLWLEEYEHVYTRDRIHINEKIINNYCSEYPTWIKNTPDCTDYEDFLEEKGIPRQTWNNWCNKYPQLKRVHQDVLILIGKRREKGLMRRRYVEGTTARSLRMYLPEWEENEKWYAQLRSLQEDVDKLMQIVIKQIPNSSEVPERGNNS